MPFSLLSVYTENQCDEEQREVSTCSTLEKEAATNVSNQDGEYIPHQ